MNSCKCSEFFKRNWFFVLLVIVGGGSVYFLYSINALQLIPATLLTLITVGFSYLAYIYNQEKIRLDLFQKRWEIFEAMIEYCSHILKEAKLSINKDGGNKEEFIKAIENAQKSFRGKGLHMSNMLFGEDVKNLIDKLNNSYSTLIVYSRSEVFDTEKARLINDVLIDVSYLLNYENERAKSIVYYMRPYLYFGDYTNR